MEIWEWAAATREDLVAKGRDGLAAALGAIPEQAMAGNVAQIDALAPGVLAEAADAGVPGIEAYVRHWRLYARVNARKEGAAALEEAGALVADTADEDADACPQSVCAILDLVTAQVNIDGPGTAGARAELISDGLSRVGVERTCHACLTRAMAEVMADEGRAEAAIDHLNQATETMVAAGHRPPPWYAFGYLRALRDLDLPAQGLDLVMQLEQALAELPSGQAVDVRRSVAFARARLLAWMARTGQAETADALAALPAPELADATPDLRADWADAVENLVALGAHPNDWTLGRLLTSWVTYFERAGSMRPGLEMALAAGRLAAEREARPPAEWALRHAEEALARLRRAYAGGDTPGDAAGDGAAAERAAADLTEDLADDIAEVAEALEALPEPELPVPAKELVAYLRADEVPDPERHAALIAVALREAPRDAELLTAYGQSTAALELAELAVGPLWAAVEDDPGDPGYVLPQLETLLRAGDADGLERLAGLAGERAPVLGHWVRARLRAAQGEAEGAVEECAAVAELDPGALNARRLWADLVTERGDWAAAHRLRREIVDLQQEPEPTDWWALAVAGTAAGAWADVRAAAAALELDVDAGEGPIDEQWHPVRVAFPDPVGEVREALALRTGPATARVAQVLPQGQGINAGDLVLFEPAPMEPVPEEPEERAAYVPLFARLTVLEDAGFSSFVYDGVYPGDGPWQEFRQALAERSWPTWDYLLPEDDGGYRVTGPEGTVHPGVYGLLALPPGTDPAEADRALTELTAAWDGPLAWVDLARAAGADPARHEKIITDYGL
ncbi:MAG: hypothetical protein GEV11_03525 [Streptosporangiales bacterium]|nr:hypothetical protein [Streptosporangiales bacterium]